MKGFSNVDQTYREYSVVSIDDLIRFWRSNVKGQGHSKLSRWRPAKASMHVDAGAYKSIF